MKTLSNYRVLAVPPNTAEPIERTFNARDGDPKATAQLGDAA